MKRKLAVKYGKTERLGIVRRIYEGKLTRFEAAEKCGISDITTCDYRRIYRDENQLPSKKQFLQLEEEIVKLP